MELAILGQHRGSCPLPGCDGQAGIARANRAGISGYLAGCWRSGIGPNRIWYREVYFDAVPWREDDDWHKPCGRGPGITVGRYDAILNRRGQVLTPSFGLCTAVVNLDDVADSRVVHRDALSGELDQPLPLVVLDADSELDEVLRSMASRVRNILSPRHILDQLRNVAAVESAISGKESELPAKWPFGGAMLAKATGGGVMTSSASLAAHESATWW